MKLFHGSYSNAAPVVVVNIAENSDLNDKIDDVVAFLADELNVNPEIVAE